MKSRRLFSFPGLLFLLTCLAWTAHAQQPLIRVTQPSRSSNSVTFSPQYIAGSTCTSCSLTVNGKAVKIYPTGSFAIQLDLQPGDSVISLKSTDGQGHTTVKSISYHYAPPPPEKPVSDFRIAAVETFPAGDLWLQPGDAISIRVKAQPGCNAFIGDRLKLYEQPDAMPGIYQGTYIVQANDPLIKGNGLTVTLKNKSGQTISMNTGASFTLMDTEQPLIGETTGSLPYMDFGLGEDRLGGAKITYLDTAIRFHVIGRVDDAYKVALAKDYSAYVPMGNMILLPKGTFLPHSLTGTFRVWGDDHYDYVSIPLKEKLPYQSTQEIQPSRINVDIYGATSNTNWITQLKSVQEIRNVYYRQLSDDVLRVVIGLQHDQHWGYAIYYEGNNLTIRVKRPPAKPDLAHLRIAIDAGHGGSNFGARGPTGEYEKNISLQIAQKLKAELQAAGATVLMTRTGDESKDMIQRTLFLREADPNLMVSIHLNSSADPIHVSGTSTYYRYIGFRPLSTAILDHMLALGLKEYGNVGRFNFALNGPTEFPNALVETVFLSNPGDEMKALNPVFQQQIADAITAGIRDFLKDASP